MAQRAKIIDLTQSFVPGDPNAFPENLHYTAQEDNPDNSAPILPYEGYNILPTSYGYRSYFGTEATLTLAALSSKCDKILTLQSKTYQNMLVALCANGIWTAKAGETVWTYAISLPDDYTSTGTYRQYTYTVIENELYIYRQGYAKVIKINSSLVVSEFIPSFLNMAGQSGIFRGNGRLCFWDAEDSVAWSSAVDLTDFTPSIENMVGNTKFLGVLGRIVMVLPHGDGFVIYCTRSIVGVTYSTTGTEVWKASPVNSAGGIAHPGAVCQGQNDEEHFAYTSFGFIQVGHYNALSSKFDAKIIMPEVFDFLKEAREPVYLACHDARFLFISVINDTYINGRTSWTDVEVPTLAGPVIKIDTSKWDSFSSFPYISPKDTFNLLDSFFVEPTGLITPAITRTSSPHNESRWMATMLLPNLTYVAADKGKFSGPNSAYKSREYFLEAQPTVANRFPDIDAHCRQFSAGGSNGGGYQAWNSWGITLFDSIPVSINTIQPDQVTTTSATERSIFTNLYSQFIPNIDTGGISCMDLIYHFMSAVNEYRYICRKNEEQLRKFLVEVLNTVDYERLVYVDIFGNPSYVDSNQSASIYYMPRDKGHVTIDMIQGDATNKASIAFNYTVSEYLKIVHVDSRTSWRNKKLVNIADTPIGVTMYLGYPGATGIYHYIDHEPTVDEVMAFYGDPANSINGTNPPYPKYVLNYMYDMYPSISSSDIASGSPTCHLRDITTGNVIPYNISSRLSYDSSLNSMNTSPWKNDCRLAYMSSEMLADLSKYPYIMNLSSVINYTNLTFFSPAILFMAFNNYILRPTSIGNFYLMTPPTGNPTFSFIATPPSMVYSDDGRKCFIYATIKNNSTSAIYKNVVVAIFYTNEVYEITAVENQIISMDTASYNSASSTSRETLQLFFTETDRDTLTKNTDDSWSIANYKHFFTPTWVDPGPNQPLNLTSLPAGTSFKTPNASFPYSVQNCIPWDFFKNNAPTTKVIHGIDPTRVEKGLYIDNHVDIGPINYLPANYVCYGYDADWDGFTTIDLSDFTYPSTTFQLQDGIPAPAYPTLSGSLILDLHLKKWGKQASKMNALIQYTPINALDTGIIDYTNFGTESGILAPDGSIRLFAVPTKSGYLRYGKIGLYRLGFTEVFEVIAYFRTPSTGKIVVDGSVDGKDLDVNVQHTESFTNARSHVVKCHLNVRWYTVSIYGNFDLSYLEVRGIMAGRR